MIRNNDYFFCLTLTMNIKRLFTNFENKEKELNLILQGFENSPYYCNNISVNNLFKDLVTMFINVDKNILSNEYKDYLNALTGGLRTCLIKKQKAGKQPAKPPAKEEDKTNNKILTFTSDLKIILNNIIGLIGYEFATSLMTIAGMPKLIRHNIEAIESAETYNDIGKLMTIIVNIYRLQGGTIFKVNCPFDDTIKGIYRLIKRRIEKEQNTSFKADKDKIVDALKKIYENTEFDNIYIKSIDNLCINCERVKPCYDGYFIKLWELLFKETYADYYEFENVYPKFKEDVNKLIIPYVEIIQEYIKKIADNGNLIMSLSKYSSQLSSYFNKIYKDVHKVVYSNGEGDLLNVVVSEQFYEHLSAIAINLIIILAKNVVISQSYLKTTMNATRLQFIQMFNGIRCCVPTLLTYNESQLYVLHYVLLTNHVLVSSNTLLHTKEEEPAPAQTITPKIKKIGKK